MQERRMNENNDWGSIGIGAMIVFIALILVAAVASAVIIQTGEKLQQNAQQTGSDTQEEIGGKVSIIAAMVGDQTDCDGDADGDGVSDDEEDRCITLVYELAAGSEPVLESQISWSITCTDDATGATQRVWGSFDGFATNTDAQGDTPNDQMNLDTVNVDGSEKLYDEDSDGNLDDDDDTLNPANVYMISLKTSPDEEDGGANSADDVPEMAQGECNPFLNEKHNLIISVVGGGTTHEILSYTSTDEGALII
jgi:archaellin